MGKAFIRVIASLLLLSMQSCATLTQVAGEIREERRQEQQAKDAARNAARERKDSLITAHAVVPGFTRREVLLAWGRPTYRSSIGIEKEFRRLHQWVYEDKMRYVYFLGNRMISSPYIIDTKKKTQDEK